MNFFTALAFLAVLCALGVFIAVVIDAITGE